MPTLEKEFSTVSLKPFKVNFERYLKDATKETQLAYLERFATFCGALPNDELYQKLAKRIQGINQKRAVGNIKDSTVRQYKACFAFGLSMVAYKDRYELNPTFQSLLMQSLSIDQASRLYEVISNWSFESNQLGRKLDNIAHLNANTSSHKAKYFNPQIISIIQENDSERYERIRLFINANIIVGLRPSEWFKAKLMTQQQLSNDRDFIQSLKSVVDVKELKVSNPAINGSEGKLYLKVENSKNSHDRACGDYRYLILDNLSEIEMDDILNWLAYIEAIKIQYDIDSDSKFDKFLKNTQSQLLRFCKSNQSVQKIIMKEYRKSIRNYTKDKVKSESKSKKDYLGKPPIALYPTLYSTRHQAIANAKAQGINPILIAALFGHASIKTAQYHYGKKHKANGRSMLSPHKINVKEVIKKISPSQIELALKIKVRKPSVETTIKPHVKFKP